jgi:hypothetical protein
LKYSVTPLEKESVHRNLNLNLNLYLCFCPLLLSLPFGHGTKGQSTFGFTSVKQAKESKAKVKGSINPNPVSIRNRG